MVYSPAEAFRPFSSSWPQFQLFQSFRGVGVQSASLAAFLLAAFLLAVVVATCLALAFLQVLLMLFGVEVGGKLKFVEVLVVRNLCEFNRK
jgi:hypothetical protein